MFVNNSGVHIFVVVLVKFRLFTIQSLT